MGRNFYFSMAMNSLKSNRRTYVPYALTCVGTSALYYIISALAGSQGLAESYGGGELTFMLGLGANVIAVFSVLFLFYTNSFIVKRRKKEYGLYNILGMEKKHIARLMLCETVIVAAASIIAGLLSGVLLTKVMHLLLLKILHLPVQMGIELTAAPFLHTTLLFLSIFALTFLNTVRHVHLSRPIELLKGTQSGEREPKVKWPLVVIGLLSIGLGYYIALTVESPITALLLFFVAVILVIIGTYCLFISGSIAFLKLLKRNKGYYYQARHFISVSGMLYRMKQNAAGLASICIFCTAVLVTLSTTVSLYVGVEDVLRTRFPRDLSVTLHDSVETERAAVDQIIEASLTKRDIAPEQLTRHRYREMVLQGDADWAHPAVTNFRYDYDITTFIVMPLQDFNANTGGNYQLEPGEVLLNEQIGSIPGDRFSLAGIELKIRERIDQGLIYDKSSAILAAKYLLVVKDEAAAEALFARSSGAEDLEGDFSYFYGFDLSIPKDEQIALYEEISAGIQAQQFASSYAVDCLEKDRDHIFTLYGMLFFVGLFLGAVFIMATVLTIYYKQISEGYDDNERFIIMQQVGMSKQEVRKAIRSQVLTVFFLPLIVAAIHVAAAFKMITTLLSALNVTNIPLFALCCAATLVIFSVFYALIYLITARTYYKIVSVR